MLKILTRRKEAWKNKFKPNIIRGLPLSPSAGVEQRYSNELQALILIMTREVYSEVISLFESETGTQYFAEDKSITAQARILANKLKEKFQRLFAINADSLAERMTRDSEKSASKSLHSSIQKLSGGLTLPTRVLEGQMKEVVKVAVEENVALIKSIPQKYLSRVEQAVMRSITTGNGLADLVPYLAKGKGITLRRARFIASDQTKKVFENICSTKMKKLGLDDFEWLHVASNHPRKTHVAFAGNIYKLSEGAYDTDVKRNVLPGELPGCRCKKVPVIKFGEENAD